MTLKRHRSFGDRTLDAFLDEIVAAVNEKSVAVSTETEQLASSQVAASVASSVASTGAPAYLEYMIGVNDGPSALTPWLVMGLDSNRKPRLSTGGDADVRPLGVVTRDSGRGQPLYVASGGVIPVIVESGVTPSKGDPCYVSVSSAGRVTSSRPATGKRYLIGTFWGEKRSNGRAEVVLFLNLVGARVL